MSLTDPERREVRSVNHCKAGDGRGVIGQALGVIDLPGVVRSVPLARKYVANLLADFGYPQSDDVALLVSEVVTNAVVHTASGKLGGVVTVAVEVATGQNAALIEVIDDGSTSDPRPQVFDDDEDDLASGGRGLWLVETLAESWGVREVERGRKAVWMRVSLRNPKEAA
ncbi:ATP-binding protein [Streptosporangium saharense]|uniref:ATP-binding protein n=1 Tax=Streptosporangium saharense TaxID=1706840 RepID=UPI0033341D70